MLHVGRCFSYLRDRLRSHRSDGYSDHLQDKPKRKPRPISLPAPYIFTAPFPVPAAQLVYVKPAYRTDTSSAPFCSRRNPVPESGCASGIGYHYSTARSASKSSVRSVRWSDDEWAEDMRELPLTVSRASSYNGLPQKIELGRRSTSGSTSRSTTSRQTSSSSRRRSTSSSVTSTRPSSSSSTSAGCRQTARDTDTRHPSELDIRDDTHLTMTLHPLLRCTPNNQAAISYDILHRPSTNSIYDRNMQCPVSAKVLEQPATEPPLRAPLPLVLTSPMFAWKVVVSPLPSTSADDHGSESRSSSPPRDYINVRDVLLTIHDTLLLQATHREWDALGEDSKAQRTVAWAYERRCQKMGGGKEEGVKRVDWLAGKTKLVGIELTRDEGKVEARMSFRYP